MSSSFSLAVDDRESCAFASGRIVSSSVENHRYGPDGMPRCRKILWEQGLPRSPNIHDLGSVLKVCCCVLNLRPTFAQVPAGPGDDRL